MSSNFMGRGFFVFYFVINVMDSSIDKNFPDALWCEKGLVRLCKQ